MSTSLQAISLLRQKKLDETAKSLNNLLACDRALPADRAVSWDERTELQDLFSTYVSRVRLLRCVTQRPVALQNATNNVLLPQHSARLLCPDR